MKRVTLSFTVEDSIVDDIRYDLEQGDLANAASHLCYNSESMGYNIVTASDEVVEGLDIHTYRLMENAVNLSAALTPKLIKASEKIPAYEGMRERAEYIIEKAQVLEKRLDGKDEDEGKYDYIEELDKFVKECEEEITLQENPIPLF